MITLHIFVEWTWILSAVGLSVYVMHRLIVRIGVLNGHLDCLAISMMASVFASAIVGIAMKLLFLLQAFADPYLDFSPLLWYTLYEQTLWINALFSYLAVFFINERHRDRP